MAVWVNRPGVSQRLKGPRGMSFGNTIGEPLPHYHWIHPGTPIVTVPTVACLLTWLDNYRSLCCIQLVLATSVVKKPWFSYWRHLLYIQASHIVVSWSPVIKIGSRTGCRFLLRPQKQEAVSETCVKSLKITVSNQTHRRLEWNCEICLCSYNVDII